MTAHVSAEEALIAHGIRTKTKTIVHVRTNHAILAIQEQVELLHKLTLSKAPNQIAFARPLMERTLAIKFMVDCLHLETMVNNVLKKRNKKKCL